MAIDESGGKDGRRNVGGDVRPHAVTSLVTAYSLMTGEGDPPSLVDVAGWRLDGVSRHGSLEAPANAT
jgi:hypothetical protein